jgi:zinc/manganese transport system substrate-binding protein
MRGLLCFLVATALGLASAEAAPLRVVAAENFYGDVVAQLGGPEVTVVSILNDPEQDPHLFEVSASAARAVAEAAIVVFNGAGYDPWMEKLLAASPVAGRDTIEIARLLHKAPGEDPHLWYDPRTMPVFADALTAALTRHDPAHQSLYEARRVRFEAALKPLTDKIASLKQRYAGTQVTATEPVFGSMAAAIGLAMRNESFQRAVMNDTEPGAAEIAAFQNDLRGHVVKVLIYNRQTSEGLTRKMQALAKQSGVPVVGVGETEPAGMTYQGWMLSELDQLDTALSGKAP